MRELSEVLTLGDICGGCVDRVVLMPLERAGCFGGTEKKEFLAWVYVAATPVWVYITATPVWVYVTAALNAAILNYADNLNLDYLNLRQNISRNKHNN